eukprot:Amastigsp_a509711_4.p3 type:complete len:121 gc:universal Amastigsp_a509711_4:101-463(+)
MDQRRRQRPRGQGAPRRTVERASCWTHREEPRAHVHGAARCSASGAACSNRARTRAQLVRAPRSHRSRQRGRVTGRAEPATKSPTWCREGQETPSRDQTRTGCRARKGARSAPRPWSRQQ